MTAKQIQTQLGFSLAAYDGTAPSDIIRHQYRNTFLLEGEDIIGLNLLGNDLKEDKLSWLSQLPRLKYLNLSENSLSSFTIPESLSELELLNLSENKALQALQLPKTRLINLQKIHIHDCQLQSLEIPEGLLALQWLDLARNKELKTVDVKGDCPKLGYLDLSDNQLSTFTLPVGFARLKYLYLVNNQLETLEFQSDLPSLNTLHLRNNRLKDLPGNFLNLSGLEVVYLHGNPWVKGLATLIPEDERANGIQAARSYAQESRKGTIPNDRVKIIVVGNGRVGKTSLIRVLKGEDCQEDEEPTFGITLGEITHEHLSIEGNPSTLRGSVWDFGGQEIFFATHQYFLSDSSLYILAWTSEDKVKGYRERDRLRKKENEKIFIDNSWRNEFTWVQNIRYKGRDAESGSDSPLIMVQTHCDSDPLDYTASTFGLERKDCIEFSAQDTRGLIPLRKAIVRHLKSGQTVFGQPIPQTYENVIQKIQDLRSTHPSISLDEFKVLCSGPEGAGIEIGNEMGVLTFLRKTGVVVHLHDSPQEWLQQTVFIDPNWLTERTYLIINDDLLLTEGIINESFLAKHLPSPDFDEAGRKKLLELLENFKLIFRDTASDQLKYVSPHYLPDKFGAREEKLIRKLRGSLDKKLWIQFPEYLPDHIMINFLATYGPFSDHLYYKYGISFDREEEDLSFLVTQDNERGCFLFQTKDTEEGGGFFREVLSSFLELSKDATLEVSLDGENFVLLEELISTDERNQVIRSSTGVDLLISPFADFFQDKMSNWLKNHQFEKVNKLIGKGQLGDAVLELKGLVEENQRLHLQTQINQYNRDLTAGVLSEQERIRRRNVLFARIISLIEDGD